MNLNRLGAMLALATMPLTGQSAFAGSEPFIGEIAMVGTNFCPRGWVEADGQLISIAQNSALFSLYGTQYGGDGRTTFALPDLRGRTPIHVGRGPGLSEFQQGQKGGQEQIDVTKGNDPVAAGRPYLVVRYCVAYKGVFPSRN